MKLRHILIAAALLLFCQTSPAGANTSNPVISVLEFELNDLTLDPGNSQELERTASIAPLLREYLQSDHGFQLADIDADTQRTADEAFGYLYEHQDVAAKLGREAASDWIIVGRLHKASFLFVFLMARVVNTNTQELVAELSVEVKGPQKRLTAKGVETLARQITEIINANYR